MPEKKHRIRMITGWTGPVDGEIRNVKAGEEIDVDLATVRALVMQHSKAELVPVDEILAKAKTPPKKKPAAQRASRTKGKKVPDKDKMVKGSTQK